MARDWEDALLSLSLKWQQLRGVFGLVFGWELGWWETILKLKPITSRDYMTFFVFLFE